MNQTWENDKKLVLGPILVSLAQILPPNFFFVDFSSTGC